MADVQDRDYYAALTDRTRRALGDRTADMLSRARVILFGAGGVGSWCAEAMVRSGISDLTIVDRDTVCPTNANRQAQATSLNIGAGKADEMKRLLLAVNPGASVTAVGREYAERSRADFDLASYDYVIDAIDSLDDKVLLIKECLRAGVTLFSSMGAAMKTDPTRVKTGPLSDTSGCPLARLVRKRLRAENLDAGFTCVYSDEPPLGRKGGAPSGPDHPAGDHREKFKGEKRAIGSLVHVTAVFGFTLASLVINDIAARASGEARDGA